MKWDEDEVFSVTVIGTMDTGNRTILQHSSHHERRNVWRKILVIIMISKWDYAIFVDECKIFLLVITVAILWIDLHKLNGKEIPTMMCIWKDQNDAAINNFVRKWMVKSVRDREKQQIRQYKVRGRERGRKSICLGDFSWICKTAYT